MLNQSKSNIKNAWKYFVILPALALFLMSFNVETVEVVKEPIELPTASDLSTISNTNLLTNFKTTNNSTPSNLIAKKLAIPQVKTEQKIIEAKIDKNTTDDELKKIATSLKNDGINFSYKDVKRNSSNEITGISVTYKDSDGNTGNYALSSDNPINAFRFYKEENGSIGFKSENVNAKKYREYVVQRELSKEDRDKVRKEREMMMQERMKFMEEREAMSEERRQELEERMEKAHAERKEEMMERRKEMEIHMKEARKEHAKAREEHEKQRKIIIKERIKLHDSLKDKLGNFFIIEENDNDGKEMIFSGKSKAMFIVDGEEEDEKIIELLSPEDIAHINVLKGDHAIKMYGKKGKDGVIVIKTKPHGENDFEFEFDNDFTESNVEVIVDPNMELEWVSEFGNIEIQTIDKNTSNEDLKAIKSDLNSKNIDFAYSKVKRNKDGEITRIKISLNDKDGNKSSSTFDKGNKAISPVLIGKNRSNLIIKSI